MSLDPERLARALARMAGGASLTLSNLVRLSGGANMESWSFDWGGAGYVLRRAPSAALGFAALVCRLCIAWVFGARPLATLGHGRFGPNAGLGPRR